MYRRLPHLLALSALVTTLGFGCGPSGPPRDTFVDKEYPVPQLRFAGVDLMYSLRRVGGEAGVVVLIDELRVAGTQAEDLAIERVDLDLAAGDIRDALEALYDAAPVFDYRVEDGLMLVRSRRVLGEPTALDVKDMPASKVEVDFRGLLAHIMQERPQTFLKMGSIVGLPARLKVPLEIKEGDSVLDVFVQFARKTQTGIRIRRAGYRVSDDLAPGATPKGAVLISATTVEMMKSLNKPRPLARWRNENGIVRGLAHMETRLGKPFIVRDRSLLQDNRGSLNFRQGKDSPRHPVQHVLNSIGTGKGGRRDKFSWTEDDAFLRIDSTSFDDFPTGRVILSEELEPGLFEGTLAELTRWVNANRKDPSTKILMGGEIVAARPRAKIEIPAGMTVEELLYQFARETGEGWVYVVRDNRYPHQPVKMGTWTGAYLSRLQDWGKRENES